MSDQVLCKLEREAEFAVLCNIKWFPVNSSLIDKILWKVYFPELDTDST